MTCSEGTEVNHVIYTVFKITILVYGSVLFENCTSATSDMIDTEQREAALTITGACTNTSCIHLLHELGVSLLPHRTFSKIILMYKVTNNLTPVMYHFVSDGIRPKCHMKKELKVHFLLI